METTEKNLIENLLNLALKSGADEAEVIVAKGQGQSAECRLGKIEAVERSEAQQVFLQQKWTMTVFKKWLVALLQWLNLLQKTLILV